MKKLLSSLVIWIFWIPFVIGQNGSNSAPSIGIKFSGYIKTDIFYDTRQTSAPNGIREGHFYLFPDNALYDADSNDVNSSPSFHMLSIQSRVRTDFTGPDALGAKSTAAIEAEFFGTSESDLNGVRLRHAYIKLDWSKTSLLIGQTWHPMFPATCFPGVISFNTGAPFNPFSRNPQIRFSFALGKVIPTVTAYSQRDFTSTGPDGYSNKYMRNSALPGVNLQIKVPVNAQGYLILGGDYKTLRPQLKSSTNYENKNIISSFAGFLTANYKTKSLIISAMGTLAQNATDLVMIGGYAVREVSDTIRKINSYSNINTASAWLDIGTNGKKVQFGLFAGYSKNLGSTDKTAGPAFARGDNIDHLFRISPRISVTHEKLTFAFENENTWAAYGKPNEQWKISDAQSIVNNRFLLAVYFKF